MLLYIEMVIIGVIIYGKGDYLVYSEEEYLVVLQFGGSDFQVLVQCVKLVEVCGYDEINFNVGCFFDCVQNGMFGVCLMGNVLLVVDCIKVMCDVVLILVMVKICIGIDDQDSYEFLCDFIEMVFGKGECEMFIIYVCKVWFFGLSLKENCEILLLDYFCVWQLKCDFFYLMMVINGGIKLLDEVRVQFEYMDGVMVGCEVYQNLGILVLVDCEIFGVVGVDVDLVVVV